MIAPSSSIAKAATAAAAKPCARASAVVCRASSAAETSSAPIGGPSRRALLAAATAGLSALAFARAPQPALALIPDEEDNDMLEKAKANRRKRLEEQRETTREFLNSEGLENRLLEAELVPVQRLVLDLAKSGAQLDAGDVKGAAATLQRGSGLVSDFEKAADAIAGPGKERAADVAAGVRALREAAGKGDAAGSKRQYVALVGALQGWADASGVAVALKGL